MRISYRCFALTAIVFMFFILLRVNFQDRHWTTHDISQSNNDSNLQDGALLVNGVLNAVLHGGIGKRRRKKILIYTALFGAIPWKVVPSSYNFTDFDGRFCPVYDCDVTYDKDQIKSSDLVVFHGRDLPSPEHLKSVSRTSRPSDQYWLFFMHESPVYSYFNVTTYNGLFNLTASYRSDSDVLVNYHFYGRLRDWDPKPDEKKNFAEGKTKLITWMNSHCDEDRVTFIHKLRKYVSLDVYGGCSRLFEPKTPACPRGSKKCTEIQNQYKFFLAIENGFCIDYITEKYWLNGLDAGLVPVVLGFGNYSDKSLTVPGSFIDARKFDNLQQLADFLLYLDKNDTAYNEYHQWRYKYRLYPHHCMCLFCDAIQTYFIPPKTVDLESFWGTTSCDLAKSPLRRLIANS